MTRSFNYIIMNKKDLNTFKKSIIEEAQKQSKLRLCKKTNKLEDYTKGFCAICNCYD